MHITINLRKTPIPEVMAVNITVKCVTDVPLMDSGLMSSFPVDKSFYKKKVNFGQAIPYISI